MDELRCGKGYDLFSKRMRPFSGKVTTSSWKGSGRLPVGIISLLRSFRMQFQDVCTLLLGWPGNLISQCGFVVDLKRRLDDAGSGRRTQGDCPHTGSLVVKAWPGNEEKDNLCATRKMVCRSLEERRQKEMANGAGIAPVPFV